MTDILKEQMQKLQKRAKELLNTDYDEYLKVLEEYYRLETQAWNAGIKHIAVYNH